MRTYLTVIDETEEARVALRFAARRAAKTGGAVHILAFTAPSEFAQWGAVQAAMEEEEKLRIDALVAQAAGELSAETGQRPVVTIRGGEAITAVEDMLVRVPDLAALVLGAAASGKPGLLVEHFTGPGAGQLPCPVMIVPGSLDAAAIDRLS